MKPENLSPMRIKTTKKDTGTQVNNSVYIFIADIEFGSSLVKDYLSCLINYT